MIVQNILEEEDKNQALDLIKTSWPEKNSGYLNFFLKENQVQSSGLC